eukprot:330676_1
MRVLSKKNENFVEKWLIGETIKKSRYSCFKKGIDRQNGEMVAIRFIHKRVNANGKWHKTQQINIQTEIEALKCLNHNNIISLLGYNLNESKLQNTAIYVLQYAPAHLFDLLYYYNMLKLESIIARTYFRQLVSAVSYMHENGIIHRDIKRQNLLLDHNYTLKVTGF